MGTGAKLAYVVPAVVAVAQVSPAFALSSPARVASPLAVGLPVSGPIAPSSPLGGQPVAAALPSSLPSPLPTLPHTGMGGMAEEFSDEPPYPER